MSEETVTLKEFIMALIALNDSKYDQRFTGQKEAVKDALEAANAAVRKAEMAAERRFEGVNEFRNTLADQQRTLIPRAEVEVLVSGLNKEIEGLKVRIAAAEQQKQGGKDLWVWLIAAVGLIATLLAIASRFLPLTH